MAGETACLTTDNQWVASFGGVGIQPAKDFFSILLETICRSRGTNLLRVMGLLVLFEGRAAKKHFQSRGFHVYNV
jgi:hypothetical protein